MPATTWSVNRHLPGSSRANDYLSVLMASLRFRHFISGSPAFVSIGAYLTKSRFAFSRNAHHHGFSPTAACGGLEPPPVWRPRRALPHLRLSMASGLSARLPSWRTIVGAIDLNPALEGKDVGEVGEVAGLGFKINVPISSNAERVFRERDADACVIATRSLMPDVYDAFELAARHGVNAISTCEEAFYPWNTSPALTNRLDRLAKENGCTLAGSGYQDVFWGNLITTLAGSSHRIDRIEGVSSYNVEDYGIALAEVHGAGLSLEQFEKEIAQSDSLPSFMWNSNEWLCSQFGWSIKSTSQKLVPTTHDKDLNLP